MRFSHDDYSCEGAMKALFFNDQVKNIGLCAFLAWICWFSIIFILWAIEYSIKTNNPEYSHTLFIILRIIVICCFLFYGIIRPFILSSTKYVWPGKFRIKAITNKNGTKYYPQYKNKYCHWNYFTQYKKHSDSYYWLSFEDIEDAYKWMANSKEELRKNHKEFIKQHNIQYKERIYNV